MDAAYCYSCGIWRGLSLLVTIVSFAKTAEPTEMRTTHMATQQYMSHLTQAQVGATWRIRRNAAAMRPYDHLLPSPSAHYMTLPAFAAERLRLQHGVAAIDRYLLQTPAPLSIDGTDRRTDRRTDGRTPDRYKDPAARIACEHRHKQQSTYTVPD